MNDAPSPLEIAKQRLRIPELWELRHWPGKPGKSCKFPDGADKNASASVFRDGLLLRDFRSEKTYDAPALLAEVESLTPEAACRLFIELAGVAISDRKREASERPTLHPPRLVECDRGKRKQIWICSKSRPSRLVDSAPVERTKPRLPPLERGSEADICALALLRDVSIEAVRLADARGLLWFAESTQENCRSWIVTDRERWNAIARRLDGKTWRCLPSQPKARTLRGAWASWPIGLPEAAAFPAIAMTEGAPDFLAAFHFATQQGTEGQIAPVCMAGAGLRIPLECLPLFAGKRVRVFVHDDDAGRAAFEKWGNQLTEVGATVDGFDFSGLYRDDGLPVSDLNDLCRIGPDSFEQWGEMLATCMSFAPVSPVQEAENKAAALLTPRERDILKRAGCENEPLIMAAVEMFGGRIEESES